MKKIVILSIILLRVFVAEAQNFSGTVNDAETKKPLAGVSISIKGKNIGTATNSEGFFRLKTATPIPFTLVFSMIGYERQTVEVSNNSPINVSLKSGNELLQQVVISASRIEENIQKSPISIEKMDTKAIQQSPSVSFYDALLNVKSLDMVTRIVTGKQIGRAHV